MSMTSDEFRLLALGLSQVRLVNQLGNQNFLIGDRVFASLSAPDPAFAILKLAPETQASAVKRAPSVFSPQPGGAGARGVTSVRLALATSALLMPVLKAAAARAANGRAQRTVLSPR